MGSLVSILLPLLVGQLGDQITLGSVIEALS